MLDIPICSSRDLRTSDRDRQHQQQSQSSCDAAGDSLARSQSVRRTGNLCPTTIPDGPGQQQQPLCRSASLRLPNRGSGSLKINQQQQHHQGSTSGLGSHSGSVKEGGFRKMSKFFHESLLGGENVKQEFVRLFEEQETSQIEFRSLRRHLEALARDYEEAAATSNWLTKYRMLKAMIKRAVMHLKIGDDCCQLVSPAVAKEISRKVEEKYQELDSETLLAEKGLLRDQIDINRFRVSLLKEVFGDLDTQYSASKKYSALTRYQMLNALIKDLLARPNVHQLL